MGLQVPGSVFAPDSSNVPWSWGQTSGMFHVALGRRRALSGQQLLFGWPPLHRGSAGVGRGSKNEASTFMADVHILW